MDSAREPTEDEITRAAWAWRNSKDRETDSGDDAYFRNNWRALPGLRTYVDAILSRPGGVDNAQADELRDMLVAAYEDGAHAVHKEHDPEGRDPFPEFGEAAHDYADHALATRAAGGREPPNAGSADDLVELFKRAEWFDGIQRHSILIRDLVQALTKLQAERDALHLALMHSDCEWSAEKGRADTALRQLDEAREGLRAAFIEGFHSRPGRSQWGDDEAWLDSRARSILSPDTSERSPASLARPGGDGSAQPSGLRPSREVSDDLDVGREP